VFAAALLARWPLIQRGDTLLHFDEAIVGLMARDIAAGERFPIYFYGQRYMGALEAYVIAGLSFVIRDPVIALRLGPALFFAALVAVQYLMLTRWLGRRGGLIGALILVCGPPMFAHWSISARGGYIEILLWGSLLLWSYAEWFAAAGQRSSLPDSLIPARQVSALPRELQDSVAPANSRWEPQEAPATGGRRLLFGLILGSGLWINPSIVLFVAPILLHAALVGWPAALSRWTRPLGHTALPVLAIASLLLMNCVWASWVEEETPRSLLLLGILPRGVAIGTLALAAILVAALLARRPNVFAAVRACATRNAAMILGVLLGAAPAALYVVQAAVGLRELEPSLPLGLRPLWKTGETMVYLLHGLPVLFGADPRPFVDLVTIGRERSVADLSDLHGTLIDGINWMVLGGLSTTLLAYGVSNRRELGRLLRLEPGLHSPPTLLAIGFATTVALYLFGGCSFSFTTIRYLLPIWAFLPGLLSFVFTRGRPRWASRLAPLCLCAVWAIGQITLARQLGHPHPLREVAAAIQGQGVRTATADILDAHLLSYLTAQSCRVREHEPFWPRLSHYRAGGTAAPGRDSAAGPADYIVNTREFDRTGDWISAGWPGPPPPETQRSLWPAIQRALIREPSLLISRRPLARGCELIRLRRPLQQSHAR